MYVHARHLMHVGLLCMTNTFHDLVILVGRKHANEGHHALHKSAPAWGQAIVLWLVHHFVHRHHGTFHVRILRESRNRVGVLRDVSVHRSYAHALHVLFKVLL